MELIIAPTARRDIASILAWTQENFGPHTLKRYAKLIQTAIEEVAAAARRKAPDGAPKLWFQTSSPISASPKRLSGAPRRPDVMP